MRSSLIGYKDTSMDFKTKLIFSRKRNSDGESVRYKARLVCKEFSQIPGVDFNETYAPVGRITTFPCLITRAVKKNKYLLH